MDEQKNIVDKMQRLFDLWGKFDRVYFKTLQHWDLSYNSFLVLEELLRNPAGEEPAVLSDRLNIPRQTMTFVLDGLEKDGLLAREPHPGDRRRKRIRLTPQGTARATEVTGSIFERELEAMNALTAAEQEQLLALYDKLQNAFELSFARKTPQS